MPEAQQTAAPTILRTHQWFSHRPASAARARRWVRETLAGAAGITQDRLDDAVTVTSELVTNAVEHSPRQVNGTVRDILVELLQGAGHLRIQVSDASTHLPALAAPVPDAEHGRGLQIVEALSTSWGTMARNGLGKTTWALIEAVGGARAEIESMATRCAPS
jgi:anti-sigma regulatory factor (Ser/Thr protein kinase)